MPPKREANSGDASSRSSERRAVEEKAYDSDEPPSPLMTNDDKLLWRQDPEESLSDWTIELSYETTAGESGGASPDIKTDTYHVHKALLAAGPRRSEYFARLFKGGGRFAESSSNTSCINLSKLEATVFPALLDYIYSVLHKLEICSETATALHHLGGYFEMRRLRWDAKQFIELTMNAASCGTFYEHAKMLNNQKILDAAANVAALKIMQVTIHSRLMHVPDESFWLKLFENATINEAFSDHTFKKLTAKECLCKINRDAAIKLIDAERTMLAPDENELTELQQRCIQAIADDWINFDRIDQSDIKLLQKQNPLVLTETLSRFANVAQKERKRFVRVDTSVVIAIPHNGFGSSGFRSYAVDGTHAMHDGVRKDLFYQCPSP